ncbi:MAG: hypothetical protein ACFFBD_06955 [Candidatus Hodarchaeota archaeon]
MPPFLGKNIKNRRSRFSDIILKTVIVLLVVIVFIIGLWASLALPAGLPPGNILFPSPVGMVHTGSTLLGALVNGLVYGAIAFGAAWLLVNWLAKLGLEPSPFRK